MLCGKRFTYKTCRRLYSQEQDSRHQQESEVPQGSEVRREILRTAKSRGRRAIVRLRQLPRKRDRLYAFVFPQRSIGNALRQMSDGHNPPNGTECRIGMSAPSPEAQGNLTGISES